MSTDQSDKLGPLPARWYVVSRDGEATLCDDEADARNVADECHQMWPHHAPYRAVLLGDVAEERERCAKLRAMARQVVDADDRHELTQQLVDLLRAAMTT